MRLGDFVVLWTPIIAVAAWSLILVAYLSPHPTNQKPLLIIQPAISSIETLNLSSAEIGMFGACVEANAYTKRTCKRYHDRKYDLTAFPAWSAKVIVRPPFLFPQVCIGISLGLSIAQGAYWMVLLLCWLCGNSRIKAADPNWYPWFLNGLQFLSLIGFFFGLYGFLIVYMLFQKTASDFNSFNELRGRTPTDHVAFVGGGFATAWVGLGALYHIMTLTWLDSFNGPKPPAATTAPVKTA